MNTLKFVLLQFSADYHTIEDVYKTSSFKHHKVLTKDFTTQVVNV